MARSALATHRNENGSLTPHDLATLLGGLRGGHHFEGSFLPLGSITVLPQPRRTFERIEEFAQGLAQNLVLNPPTIARFSREACGQYLAVLNLIWKTSLTIKQDAICVGERGEKVYYTLLAGERRYRALTFLWQEGCEECREQYGKEEKGACFRRHFKRSRVEVRLAIDITPLSALFLQMAENTHMPVPPHEEAYAYAQLFRLAKEADEKFSLATFARGVGRSPETIRNALRFCNLPKGIQAAVEKGQIPYGIAIEISRLHQTEMEEQQLEWWLLRAITENYKVPDFRRVVTQYLLNQRSGQGSLLDILTEEQRRMFEQPHFRQVVEVHTVQAMWAWIYYFGKVFQLFEEGRLGRVDSPFSEDSPVRLFRRLVDRLEQVLPHLKQFLPKKEYPLRMGMLKQARAIAGALEEALPQEDLVAVNT
jgi:hypothetical protein